MSIKISWDMELDSTINVQVIGRWTWDEFYDVIQRMSLTLDRADQPVHLLVDLTEAGPLPGGPLSHLKQVIGRTHPNVDHIIFCRTSPFLNAMIDIIAHFYPNDAHRFHYVTGRNRARDLLRTFAGQRNMQAPSMLLASTREYSWSPARHKENGP